MYQKMQSYTVVYMIYYKSRYGDIITHSININHFNDKITSYRYICGTMISLGDDHNNYPPGFYYQNICDELDKNKMIKSRPLNRSKIPDSLSWPFFEKLYLSADDAPPMITFKLLEGIHTSIPDMRSTFDNDLP
jgi:hypothetical protein